MAKAPKSVQLVIQVPFGSSERPEIQDLAVKGHTIVEGAPFVDVVLDEATLSRKTYLDAALKGARARKKAKGE